MKRLALCLTSVMIAGLSAYAEAVPGKPAPDFTAKGVDGKTYQLSGLKGKAVVLEAYNLDCPYCANHFRTGAMQELQGWATGQGAIWLVVNSVNPNHPSHRDVAAAKKEFAAQKMKATAWIDDSSGTLGKAYGLRTTPHLVVIDPQGNVAYNGAIDDKADSEGDPRKARNYVREAIDQLLADQPVKVKSTKPYGCGVKYAD